MINIQFEIRLMFSLFSALNYYNFRGYIKNRRDIKIDQEKLQSGWK